MSWKPRSSFCTAALALLAGCTTSLPLPPPAPQALAQPALSAADIRKAEQHSYWAGYAAGRRYQKQQDTQAAQAAPDTTQDDGQDQSAPAAPAAVKPPAPAVAPVQPVPPPAETYAPKGPAKQVATPLD